MLTKEEYEYIAQYRHTYETAAKQNHAKILPRSVNERLNEIIKGQKKNWGCSACCLGLYRTLYKVLTNEDAARQRKEAEMKERMAKVREAKNNKENNTEKDGRKTTEPEQLNQ